MTTINISNAEQTQIISHAAQELSQQQKTAIVAAIDALRMASCADLTPNSLARACAVETLRSARLLLRANFDMDAAEQKAGVESWAAAVSLTDSVLTRLLRLHDWDESRTRGELEAVTQLLEIVFSASALPDQLEAEERAA